MTDHRWDVISPAPLGPTILDPRAVCNLILDEVEAPIPNLDLQSLLYLAHGLHLRRTGGRPLVYGYFEAWEQGAVHPGIHQDYEVGAGPVLHRALRVDIVTAQAFRLPTIEDRMVLEVVRSIVRSAGRLEGHQLQRLVQVPGGPWQHVVGSSGSVGRFRRKITDALIQERYHHHRLVV
ncbi:Panacea domain-containing protein [Azospirillum sp. B4]|uniref:Panacea domain-containing protein n=1 Tax=Azospirillum sp. B4 TaxID=95605 RepID=UPI0003469503|nr:hypothetical protein [Azospirillum sp. B4]